MVAEHDCEELRRRFGFCTLCRVETIEDPRAAAPPLPLGEVACAFGCGKPVNPTDHRTYRRMVGWARPRSGGGTNGLSLREELAEYAHAECIEDAKKGRLGMPPLPLPATGPES